MTTWLTARNRNRQSRMAAARNIVKCRGREADGQFGEPLVALRRSQSKPRVEDNRHIAAAAALKLPHHRAGQLGGRSPVDPPQAVAALPGAEAVVVSLAHPALRMSPFIADLLRLQELGP